MPAAMAGDGITTLTAICPQEPVTRGGPRLDTMTYTVSLPLLENKVHHGVVASTGGMTGTLI